MKMETANVSRDSIWPSGVYHTNRLVVFQVTCGKMILISLATAVVYGDCARREQMFLGYSCIKLHFRMFMTGSPFLLGISHMRPCHLRTGHPGHSKYVEGRLMGIPPTLPDTPSVMRKAGF